MGDGLKRLLLIINLLLIGPIWAEPLSIQTQKGEVKLDVEIADTDESRAYGLMFRKHLADNAGMLFVYPQVRNISFWMKNTYIPLDMLFINQNGEIVHIHENAAPLSLKAISSTQPVKAAIEIGGGKAAALGIAQGDLVSHRLFSRQ